MTISGHVLPPFTYYRPCSSSAFKFLLKIKLFILHCTQFCDDINCSIVLAWFKHILVFTHVDVIP